MNTDEENFNNQNNIKPEHDSEQFHPQPEEKVPIDSHGPSLDDKIEAMLKLNWVMLPESCSIPSCNCPLMISPNGQKYCPGCEAWEFDYVKRRKQNFGEIATFNTINTGLQVKDQKIQRKIRRQPFQYTLNQSVVQCLHSKLFYLISELNNERDIMRCKEILATIKLCMEDIKMANTLYEDQ